MSKAALVRGAFAIQCRNPVLLGWFTLLTAVSACSHFSPPYGLTGTGDRSDLAIKSLNDLCRRRTIHRSKRLAKTLRLMCGSVGTEEIFLIHPCISSKRTVAPSARGLHVTAGCRESSRLLGAIRDLRWKLYWNSAHFLSTAFSETLGYGS